MRNTFRLGRMGFATKHDQDRIASKFLCAAPWVFGRHPCTIPDVCAPRAAQSRGRKTKSYHYSAASPYPPMRYLGGFGAQAFQTNHAQFAPKPMAGLGPHGPP